ncbi:MAG: phage portal protein, partial [Gammaproteobacteria bacterium]|nr:phage portal protein [Gammaproteobacteria bacterium]
MPAKTGFIERAYQKIGQLLNVLPAEEKAVSLAAINSALFGTDLVQSSGIATSSKSYQTLVDAYQSWVYICIDKIAKTVAMLPLGLYAYKKNGKWIDGHQIKTKIKTLENKKEISRYMKMDDVEKIAINNHPFLDVLKKPNPASTRFILWYDTMVRMELAGSCAWYYSKNKFGQPLEIFALPIKSSATLSIIPDDKLIYGKFKYQDGNKVTMFDP